MTEGLLRQRRNLFITCALLWFLKYGGVSLSKFSLAGFDLELANPEVLTLAIWLAFAYFLYRYYQYFTAEGLLKLEREFDHSLHSKCEPLIRSYVKATFPQVCEEGGNFQYRRLKANGWKFRGQQIVTELDSKTPISQPIELKITRWQLRRGIVLAVLESTFRNSVVTDYLLPFVLADFVLWYCGSADWSGSFINLLFEDC